MSLFSLLEILEVQSGIYLDVDNIVLFKDNCGHER